MRAGPPSASLVQAEVPKIFTECTNCGKQVLTSNLQLHEAHCLLFRCRCQHCGEALARSENAIKAAMTQCVSNAPNLHNELQVVQEVMAVLRGTVG